MNSGYDFPIFVSSTDYNLIDFRAELKDFLDGLGYRTILSSAEGFPDQTPNLAPWESCLPILDKCLMVILVVDGRYGTLFEWPGYEKIIGKDRISPTHGEYRYSRAKEKRMLIFIRECLMNDYQRYREALKSKVGAPKAEVLAAVKNELFLPRTIDFETLQFIEEIKTQQPIPWIRTFRNVTEVKHEVRRQLLNELARFFIDRECQLQELIRRFSNALQDSTPEQRQEILQKIGYTKGLIEEVEVKTKIIEESKGQIETKEKEIERLAKEKEKNREQIGKLEKEKNDLQTRVGQLERENASKLSPLSSQPAFIPQHNPNFAQYGTGLADQTDPTCQNCGRQLSTWLISGHPNFCPGCNRVLCDNCFGFTTNGNCSSCNGNTNYFASLPISSGD